MKVIFDRSFDKSLDKISDRNLKQHVEKVILQIEAVSKIEVVSNVKKMRGYKSYYRIRVGDYRIGLELENTSTLRFIIVAHRKDIYRLFP